MQIVGIIAWWYSGGVIRAARNISLRLDGMVDYFSIGLLIRTLFAPFRQISAGSVDGPIGLKVQAYFDKLLSRLIGAFMRTVLLLAGSLLITLCALGGVVLLICWLVAPLAPLIGLVLMLGGYLPWTII